MKKKFKVLVILLAILTQSCNRFLDEKPDKKLAILSSVLDAQVLLNNSRKFNIGHPFVFVASSDDMYVGYDDWSSSMTIAERNSYIWDKDVFNENVRNEWSLSYASVYYSNVILDAIADNEISYNNKNEIQDIKGQALFYRAYNFYNLLQVFSKPWSGNASKDLGIVLRLNSDLNIPSKRATVSESYEQVIKDAQEAVSLLNPTSEILTRPNKTAALSFLARVYLSMDNYEAALTYAEETLNLKSDLMDYTLILDAKVNPFERFNKEVIFHASLGAPLILYPHITRVDSGLYSHYKDNDLQKKLFFQVNLDRSYSFRGSYDNSQVLFSGLSTSEMYYIKAECMARLGQFAEALFVLRHLLETRWTKVDGETNYNQPIFNNDDEVLSYILEERRKGLLFRGLRWTDLRRLNKDPRYAKVVKRNLRGEEYVLEPNDDRYVFQIPLDVIEMTEMEQNE